MKNRKNKLINYLKLGILFFGISFTLWNCQNENIENLSDTQQTNNFEKILNIELLSQQLNLGKDNVYVDWNAPEVLQINKKDKGGIYQYDIKLKQEKLNNSDLFTDKIYYKLIVTEKEPEPELTILRFEPFKNSLNTSPSENNLKGFSGMKFIFNKEGIMQDIYTYIKGEKIASFNENQDQRKGKFTNILLPSIDGSDFNDCNDLNGNPIEGCVGSNDGGGSGSGAGGGYRTETTRNYTDWYNMCNSCDSSDGTIYNHTDGNKYIYIKTTYDGSTTRWVWVSSGNNIYVDYFDSRTGGGSRGPNFNDNDQRNYSGSSNEDTADQLPCPIGFTKIGDGCVKIIEEEDKIDTSELTGKAECLNDKLTENGNTFVKDILKKFQGISKFDINIKSVDKIFRTGTTVELNGQTTYAKGSSLINIKISTSKLSNMPALAAARTLIHEYIHADMFRKINTTNYDGDLDFKTTYEEYEQSEFESTPQHNTMADLYVNSIRDALKDFHKNVLTEDYNKFVDYFGSSPSDTFYESLAWQGLKDDNVEAYNNLSDLKKIALNNEANKIGLLTKNCPN